MYPVITFMRQRLSDALRRAWAAVLQRFHRRHAAAGIPQETGYHRPEGDRADLVHALTRAPSLDGVDLARDPAPMRRVDLD